MKNRLGAVVGGQVIALLIVCVASTFIALVSFGGIAGVAMATSPNEVFNYVAPFTCPNGTVDYQEHHASYNRPGENQITVECVAADGTREDITFASIGYSMLGIYLACFLPMCIPGGVIAIFAPTLFLRRSKKQDSA